MSAKVIEKATTKAKPIPEGYEGATPYIIVNDARSAIEFYKKAFGAKEEMRLLDPKGRIAHAEVRIRGVPIMLADEFPESGILSPKSLNLSRPPVIIHFYVEDVDSSYKRALQAGATSLREPADQSYGDRNAQVKDPFGHLWFLATHKEDVSAGDMAKRYEAETKKQ